MQAATNPQVPVDIIEVIQGLIVLFVAAPPLIRAIFRLRAAAGRAWRQSRRDGTDDNSGIARQAVADAQPRLRSPLALHLARRDRHPVFGLFAHAGHATFQLSNTGSGTQIPNVEVPATLCATWSAAISVVIGILARGSPSRRPG